jgi:superfamily II DNA or RNA helicase
MDIYIDWNDEHMTVIPALVKLERDVLTVEVKRLVQNEKQPWKRDVRKYREKMFELIQEKPYRVIRAPQGFLDEVCIWCAQNGHKPIVADNRHAFPEPRLDLMSGFRFSQKALLEQALAKRRSGLIGAPTRYGKSRLILNTIKAFPATTTVLTMPGIDLIKQAYEHIQSSIIGREVVMMGGGSRVKNQSPDITVCSIDSLDKCHSTKTKLLLVDEPHAAVTDGRLPLVASFVNARKIGYGATLDGRFDGRDRLLTGVIGPVLANRTFKEAVAEGAICPITCLLFVMPEPRQFYGTRDSAYKDLLYMNPKVAAIVETLSKHIIPEDWQAMGFIKNEKQADYMLPFMGGDEAVVAMAKKLPDKPRRELFARMASGEIKRCLASDIYSQGVTFSDLRVVINLAGGGPYTNSIQKPGRLAEIRPDKKCGILIDIIFPFPSNPRNSASALAHDSRNRFNLYNERGYDVVFVQDLDQLETQFKKLL